MLGTVYAVIVLTVPGSSGAGGVFTRVFAVFIDSCLLSTALFSLEKITSMLIN